MGFLEDAAKAAARVQAQLLLPFVPFVHLDTSLMVAGRHGGTKNERYVFLSEDAARGNYAAAAVINYLYHHHQEILEPKYLDDLFGYQIKFSHLQAIFPDVGIGMANITPPGGDQPDRPQHRR